VPTTKEPQNPGAGCVREPSPPGVWAGVHLPHRSPTTDADSHPSPRALPTGAC